jgi:hypothetical protein
MSAGLLSAEDAPISTVGDKRLTNIQLQKSGSQKVATTQGELLRVHRIGTSIHPV